YNLSPDRAAIEGFVRLQSINAFLNMITNEKDYLPTRTSYMLNLRGPSINVQTACSTSLVAVAQACQSLLSYESDMALAGGVAVFLPQERGYFYTEGGMLSSDGHCRPFSDGASGTVFGSGVGCVVLKRLDDAMADHDNILAVIRGTALNNDGAYKASYTAPSIAGQAEVIAMAQAVADVNPEQISYVEAHGTATPLGDPIEIAALTQAFQRKTDKTQFCAVGAVKSAIGHLDAASGVAGLIKTVLALQNEELPPTLHFEQPNPEIDFVHSPFYVVNKRTAWQRGDKPRIAGISSFGVGGTNAHAIVQEAPLRERSSDGRKRQLLLLSAKTETALQTMADQLADALAQPEFTTNNRLADAAYTLTIGRTQHPYRRVVVAANSAEAIQKLRDPANPTHSKQANPEIVFMFPGQGAQYPTMGRELYEGEPVFRAAVDHCAEILEPILGEDIRQMLYPSDPNDPAAADKLKNTGNAQPAIFTIEYALAKLWLSWGVQPARMIGHSVGEFAAACLAGVFSVEDALLVIAKRAMLMRDLPGGAMRAVRLSAEDLTPYLGDGVALAAHNAPHICVVSGDYAAVNAFDQRMAALGLDTIELHTSHAFHSDMMLPMLDPFREIVASVPRNAPN
ncbi:MAG TPA: type I polyketide synthase, partial [Anaerolineae bacterium]|nr:type I polyketide synthase [Anaerolineae bacterium]